MTNAMLKLHSKKLDEKILELCSDPKSRLHDVHEDYKFRIARGEYNRPDYISITIEIRKNWLGKRYYTVSRPGGYYVLRCTNTLDRFIEEKIAEGY